MAIHAALVLPLVAVLMLCGGCSAARYKETIRDGDVVQTMEVKNRATIDLPASKLNQKLRQPQPQPPPPPPPPLQISTSKNGDVQTETVRREEPRERRIRRRDSVVNETPVLIEYIPQKRVYYEDKSPEQQDSPTNKTPVRIEYIPQKRVYDEGNSPKQPAAPTPVAQPPDSSDAINALFKNMNGKNPSARPPATANKPNLRKAVGGQVASSTSTQSMFEDVESRLKRELFRQLRESEAFSVKGPGNDEQSSPAQKHNIHKVARGQSTTSQPPSLAAEDVKQSPPKDGVAGKLQFHQRQIDESQASRVNYPGNDGQSSSSQKQKVHKPVSRAPVIPPPPLPLQSAAPETDASLKEFGNKVNYFEKEITAVSQASNLQRLAKARQLQDSITPHAKNNIHKVVGGQSATNQPPSLAAEEVTQSPPTGGVAGKLQFHQRQIDGATLGDTNRESMRVLNTSRQKERTRTKIGPPQVKVL